MAQHMSAEDKRFFRERDVKDNWIWQWHVYMWFNLNITFDEMKTFSSHTQTFRQFFYLSNSIEKLQLRHKKKNEKKNMMREMVQSRSVVFIQRRQTMFSKCSWTPNNTCVWMLRNGICVIPAWWERFKSIVYLHITPIQQIFPV